MNTGFEPFHLILVAGILVGAILLGVVIQRLFTSKLRALARKTANEWDDILLESIRGLVVLWAFLIGLAVVLILVPLRPDILTIVRRAVGVLGILSAVIFFTRMARRTINVFIDRRIEVPSSIFKNFAAFIIYLLGFLFALDYLGVSITPLLTALGVGGLAVALALQDTLSNLFAGLNILMTRKIRPGDYIRLETGRGGGGLRRHLAQHDHPGPGRQYGRRAQRQARRGHLHQHPPARAGDGPLPARRSSPSTTIWPRSSA